MNQKVLPLPLLLIAGMIVSGCAGSSNNRPEPGKDIPLATEHITVVGTTWVSPKDNMTMVFVPAGDFQLGAVEEDEIYETLPPQTVTLQDYWIDQTEVTNAMFDAFVSDTGIQTAAEKAGMAGGIPGSGGEPGLINGANWRHPTGPASNIEGLQNHPVVNVNWYDAQAYCHWVGRRLPTEAEWEKAARGTDGRYYPWGNASPSGDLVNFADVNSNNPWADKTTNDSYPATAPVGSYPDGKSPYGALDMAGNVNEWVEDWFEDSSSSGKNTVVRGGSWNDGLDLIRAVSRLYYPPRGPSPLNGFRCALSGQKPTAPISPTRVPVSAEERTSADEVFAKDQVVYLYNIQPSNVSLSDLYETKFSVQYILSKKGMVPGDPMLPGWMYNDDKGGTALSISYEPAIVDWVKEKGEFTINISTQDIGKPEYVDLVIIGLENNQFVGLSNTVRIQITP